MHLAKTNMKRQVSVTTSAAARRVRRRRLWRHKSLIKLNKGNTADGSSRSLVSPVRKHCECLCLSSHDDCVAHWQLRNAGNAAKQRCRIHAT